MQERGSRLLLIKTRGGLLGPRTFKNPEQWKVKQEVSRQLATQRTWPFQTQPTERLCRLSRNRFESEGMSFQAVANSLNSQQFRTRTGKSLVAFAGQTHCGPLRHPAFRKHRICPGLGRDFRGLSLALRWPCVPNGFRPVRTD